MASRPSPNLLSDLKLLGDASRLKILVVISERPLNVTELAGALSLNQTALSHQLKLLRVAGIVNSRREGHYTYYEVAEKYGRLVEAVFALAARMEKRRR